MKHIKTKSGFEIDLDESVLDNMELVDALAEASENDIFVSKIINILLGKDGKKRLYEHLRNKKGVVPASKVAEEIDEIFKALGDTEKN